MPRSFLTMLTAAAFTAFAATASAQTQSVAAGIQWSTLPESNSARMTPGVEVSWHRWFSPRVGLGADVRWSRDDARTQTSAGLAMTFLARAGAGRVSFIGGAGPALFINRTTFGAHALAEIDVRLAARLSVFTGLRIDWREIGTPESTFGYPAAGVRIAF